MHESMINILMHAPTNVKSNVKWNGARRDFFRPQCGIREGDPIPAYLFVLCMDKISHLIMKIVNKRKWSLFNT